MKIITIVGVLAFGLASSLLAEEIPPPPPGFIPVEYEEYTGEVIPLKQGANQHTELKKPETLYSAFCTYEIEPDRQIKLPGGTDVKRLGVNLNVTIMIDSVSNRFFLISEEGTYTASTLTNASSTSFIALGVKFMSLITVYPSLSFSLLAKKPVPSSLSRHPLDNKVSAPTQYQGACKRIDK